jgi:fatty-acid desaturase
MATAIRGVYEMNHRAQAVERTVALLTVGIPVAGAVAAIVLLWGKSVGPLELTTAAVFYFATVMGIGLGYHRLVSHHAFQTYPPLKAFLICLGSMAAQGPALYWGAIHRRHHSYGDREGDPHSPNREGAGVAAYIRGAWHAHTGWLFCHEVTSWSTYAFARRNGGADEPAGMVFRQHCGRIDSSGGDLRIGVHELGGRVAGADLGRFATHLSCPPHNLEH